VSLPPAPPLGHVAGAFEIAHVAGGFGDGAMITRGACVGCGAVVGCAIGCPQPECTGCGRARHGISDTPYPYRLLVTGSRTWDDVAAVHAALDAARAVHLRLVVVHGDCLDGADAIAKAWAEARGVPHEPWAVTPEVWRRVGRGAGPQRNAAMVASRPAECVAFIRDASRGATGCAELAERAGIPTTRHAYGQPADEPVNQPVNEPVVVIRAAQPLADDDLSLPGPVRRLVGLARDAGWQVQLTGAAAQDRRGLIVSVALRFPGRGYAMYARRDGAWAWRGGHLVGVGAVNVGRLEAAIAGGVYAPPPPRPPAQKVPCPGCGREVSLTKAGAIFKGHKCATTKVEGRS
jgi:hypothetical protein